MIIVIDNTAYAFRIRIETLIKSKKNTMIKQNISQLLESEMDRKDFLKLIGLGVIAATGINQILKAVATPAQIAPKAPTARSQALGYGDMPYGGLK